MTKIIGKIIKVAGPLVVAVGLKGAKVNEIVKVGDLKLLGEILRVKGDEVAVQVYEETSGLAPGEPVELTGDSLAAEVGPGMLGTIYDGIQRPLSEIAEKTQNHFLERGIEVPSLNREKKWEFVPVAKVGDEVVAGDVLGTVQETSTIELKIMVPFGMSGKVEKIEKGSFTVLDEIAKVDGKGVTMMQKSPIRDPRPFTEKLVPKEPLRTGWRILDTFFPMVKGGSGAIPGDFGTGKTVTLSGVAKFCDADIVVYVGCGERGNEMTEMLEVLPEQVDPKTGKSLMERTVIIANTSNMPVAAREASMYMGITVAEYYRDMGYNVMMLADSTSRWAEAMREMSGRLEEMPGEEGYPAYLGSRMSTLYARAGDVVCLGKDGRRGTVTTVGSVSPQGGDFSEPVTQNTLRLVKAFWGLSAPLAAKRHYPSIDWLTSYSLYLDNVRESWRGEFGVEMREMRDEAMRVLKEEERLQEMVQLVGFDALSSKEQLIMIVSRTLREDFLQQNAFDELDRYMPTNFQFLLLKTVMTVWDEGLKLLEADPEIEINKITNLPAFVALGRAKMMRDEGEYKKLIDSLKKEISAVK